MVSVILSLIVFLALIVWRFVLADLQRRPLVREMGAPQQRENKLLNWVGVVVTARDRFENPPQGTGPLEREDRARTYLRHIIALTGSTQTSNDYVLDVGTTRFYVRDPKCEFKQTCFCLPYRIMSKAERIATALLQLKNNPALFDRWAAQIGAVKATGQVFTHAQ